MGLKARLPSTPARHPKVDAYLRQSGQWRDELQRLRAILLDSGLSEDLKWNKPCYTFENSNVIATARLKDHCWMMIFKGALLEDHHGLLQKPGENSRSMRVIRFTGVAQIDQSEAILRDYIRQVIDVEKAGLKVDFKRDEALALPPELTAKMSKDPAFKAAFEALTPGRQRGYKLHFSAAKQAKTRESRIEKSVSKIYRGKGMNDR